MTWSAFPQYEIPPPPPSRWRHEHDQLITVLSRLLAVGLSLALAAATVFSSGMGFIGLFTAMDCGPGGPCGRVPQIAIVWMVAPWMITVATGVVASIVWDSRRRGLVVLGLGLVAQAVACAACAAVLV